MPSSSRLNLNAIFPFRRIGQSSADATAAAGPSASSQSAASPWQIVKDSDDVSIISTRPPSYRSEITIVAPPGYRLTAQITDRSSLPEHMKLEFLPESLVEMITSYLPVSSRLCLRYTCKAFFTPFMKYTSDGETLSSPLGLQEYHKCPKDIRKQRALLLAYLERDGRLFDSSEEITVPNPLLEAQRSLLTCSSCGKLHLYSAFTEEELAKSPFERRCTGSRRILYLCAHAKMTWDQYSREVLDDFPYHLNEPSAPSILTVTYARDSELSPGDVVDRHRCFNICQSWVGPMWRSVGHVPHGYVSFQGSPEQQVVWFLSWHIPLHEIWVAETRKIVTGNKPACETKSIDSTLENQRAEKLKEREKAYEIEREKKMAEEREEERREMEEERRRQEEECVWQWGSSELKKKYRLRRKAREKECSPMIEARISQLMNRLVSFEIYICPHISFAHPIFHDGYAALVRSDFAADRPHCDINCPECRAPVNMYVRVVEEETRAAKLVIITSRRIGTGESAMEGKWLGASHEPN